MIEFLSSPEVWLSLATLTALEIVLGVDNIIFIAILAGRLPASQRERARKVGLAGAFVSRMGLLATISWIVQLDEPLFELEIRHRVCPGLFGLEQLAQRVDCVLAARIELDSTLVGLDGLAHLR